MSDPILIAKSASQEVFFLPQMGNRHGLITGATGTGKTVSLQALAQHFSDLGTPVFMADVKGDLTGISQAGGDNEKVKSRLSDLGLPEPTWTGAPTTLWDVFGEKGHPVRATISDMGPLLLSRMLDLNDTQAGVLTMVFKIADDNQLLLLDLKDLRSMLQFVGDNAKQFTTDYGNVSAASIGAIQRSLLTLGEQGGEAFFGEPMLDINDLMQTEDGKGIVNILAADKLMASPRLYSTFLLWLLSELFEQLPEVGDVEKPKLVFFFDEAHLLFNEAPPALLEKIEQVVRLIRSKGVGVYFVTQNPLDIPDTVLGQLGNRVHHALRAFTPRDQKAVKTAAETLRANPAFDAAAAITELGVGEALLSFLDEKGRPNVVERAFVLPPASRIGPLAAEERQAVIKASLVYGVYENQLDRESAYEKLKGNAAAARQGQNQAQMPSSAPEAVAQGGGWLDGLGEVFGGRPSSGGRARGGDSIMEAAAKSAARAIGSQVGREIIRGVLGSILGGSSRRR